MPALKVWVANERLTSTDLNANFASVQTPDGVVASAAATAITTAITLNAVVEGKASYLSGGKIVTPRAGLYLVSGLITVGQSAATAWTVTVNGTPFVFVMPTPATMTFTFALPAVLASGAQLTCTITGGSAGGNHTIQRLGFLFLGTGYAP